jgi:DNA-binding transcriptional LysR family regulator
VRSVDLSQIDLNLLHTFRVVVDEGSVSRAARVLKRTQPAITSRLRQLETALDARLFQRVGRGIALSPVGRAIEARVREVLGGVQDILNGVRAAGGEPAGLLRIGALPTVSAYRIAPVLSRLVADYPALRVHVRVGLTQPQLDDLRRGALDVVFSVGPPPPDPRLRIETLGYARPVLVLKAATGGIPSGAISLSRVRSFDLVLYGNVGDLFFDAVWAFVEREGLDRRAAIHVPHIQTLKALVATGAGASILPDYTVVEPELTTRPLRGLSIVHPIWMATRMGSEGIPAVDELARRVRRSPSKPMPRRSD